MSNYEKYLQILNGAKTKVSQPDLNQVRNRSPLRTNSSPLRIEKIQESKYDFSRVEMPFNFMSLRD